MTGKKIAVFGMGRTGVTASLVAARLGALVTLLDQRPLDSNHQLEQYDQLQSAGVEVISSWVGQFESRAFDLLITSPGIRRDHPAFTSAKKYGIEIISEIEFAYLIAKAPILAITGTNGKSTTVVMAYLMAKACIENVYLCGNIAGSGYPELTMIEAAEIAPPEGLLVAEISSYQLEWVRSFKPKVASITRIIADHFDRHPNFEDYQNTKLKLIENLGRGDTYFGFRNAPGVEAEIVHQHLDSQADYIELIPNSNDQFVNLGANKVCLNELKVFGQHNIQNAQLAFAMVEKALGARANQEVMINALKEFTGLANRLELLSSFSEVQIVNNSMCTNPDAFIASASAMPGKMHLLVGGNSKGLDYDDAIRIVEDSGAKLYLFGDKIVDTLQLKYGLQYEWFANLEEAFVQAMKNAKEGETVMLCPGAASIPPDQDFRKRGDRFKRIVSDWIAKKN